MSPLDHLAARDDRGEDRHVANFALCMGLPPIDIWLDGFIGCLSLKENTTGHLLSQKRRRQGPQHVQDD